MVLAGSERRALRRSQRTVAELDTDSRARLRRLLTDACLVVLPTSSAVGLVTARLAPGSVTVGVAATPGLGIDQTIAVTEVLAGRGYDTRPHLAASQIRDGRHLGEVLARLRERGVRSLLVVPGRDRPGSGPPLADLVADIAAQGPVGRLGVGAVAAGGSDPEARAAATLAAASSADFVSTRSAVDPSRMLAWVAEMRIRGLEAPVELGLPGVVRMEDLRRDDPAVAGAAEGRRRFQWHDPSSILTGLAQDQSLDRLDVSGIRIETLNFLDETAGWRQRLFDLAAPNRAPA